MSNEINYLNLNSKNLKVENEHLNRIIDELKTENRAKLNQIKGFEQIMENLKNEHEELFVLKEDKSSLENKLKENENFLSNQIFDLKSKIDKMHEIIKKKEEEIDNCTHMINNHINENKMLQNQVILDFKYE